MAINNGVDMRIKVVFWMALLVFTSSVLASSSSEEVPLPKKNEVSSFQNQAIEEASYLKHKISMLNDSVSEIRRDQLNYKIEKDLLKDTYSSNMQAINVVITIVFGIFSVIGFIGIRDISKIKKEYSEELASLAKIRSRFENQISGIMKKQRVSEKEFEKLSSINEKQDIRLKILEIQETAEAHIKTGNFMRALEYILIGLGLKGNDDLLLRQRVHCHSNLGQFPEAILTLQKMLKEDPTDISTAATLAEVYLIARDVNDYVEFVGSNASLFKTPRGENIMPFLNVVHKIILGNDEEINKAVDNAVSIYGNKDGKKIPRWDFNELKMYLIPNIDKPYKVLLTDFISYLEGSTSLSGFLKKPINNDDS